MVQPVPGLDSAEKLRSWDLAAAEAEKAVDQGEYDRAQQVIDDVSGAGDEPLIVTHIRGYILYQKRRFREAVTLFDIVINEDPGRTWTRYFRILSNHQLRRRWHVLRDCLMFMHYAQMRPPRAEYDYVVQVYHDLVVAILQSRPKYIVVLNRLILRDQPKEYSANLFNVRYTNGAMATNNLFISVNKFSIMHTTQRPILITSIRKSMTHAARNIFAHILGFDKVYFPFIDHSMTDHELSKMYAEGKRIFVGHVERTLEIDEVFKDALVVLVIRDPLSCVPSKVVHFFSPESDDPLSRCIQRLGSVEAAYHYAIFGGEYKDGGFYPSLSYEYSKIALAWLDRAELVLRYEDLRSPEIETSLAAQLRGLFGADLPEDISLRIKAGLDPNLSASYVSHRGKMEAKPNLGAVIESVMPGMRKLLGY